MRRNAAPRSTSARLGLPIRKSTSLAFFGGAVGLFAAAFASSATSTTGKVLIGTATGAAMGWGIGKLVDINERETVVFSSRNPSKGYDLLNPGR